MLDISEILGKQVIETRLMRTIVLREEQTTAALEVMSRFGSNPKWLAYLPPTMSPTETSGLPDFLEHPKEAFQYFRNAGVKTVICEEKHMGPWTRIFADNLRCRIHVAEEFGAFETTQFRSKTKNGVARIRARH